MQTAARQRIVHGNIARYHIHYVEAAASHSDVGRCAFHIESHAHRFLLCKLTLEDQVSGCSINRNNGVRLCSEWALNAERTLYEENTGRVSVRRPSTAKRDFSRTAQRCLSRSVGQQRI